MTFPKSTLTLKKTISKNILNCLKINLSKILEITRKILTDLQFSLSILDFFLKTSLTSVLLRMSGLNWLNCLGFLI